MTITNLTNKRKEVVGGNTNFVLLVIKEKLDSVKQSDPQKTPKPHMVVQ